ncbi:MAG TPA: succinate dehydrogenase hydrophobic membrane anchor subunit [Actinomycetota bacterium]|nr:succinate dehydrogenase hydrophobic membrane anchor subunit [Actinomycetota bacterium]
MAVVAERRPDTAQPRRVPSGRFELWAWLFMRLSGILLLFLAVGHVLIMHVMEEGVDRVNFSFVVERWSSPFWRSWDWLMLSLALLHGINGVRVIVHDYVRSPGGRLAWNWLFASVGAALFVLGTIIVFTFDPARFG